MSTLEEQEAAEEAEVTGAPSEADGDETGDETDTGGGDEEAAATPLADTELRCEAETTVGGTLYRCALQSEHDGDHAFQPADVTANGEDNFEGIKRTSEADQRKAFQRLEAEAERHAKRLQEIMGEDAAALVQCELCTPNIPGWRFPVSPSEDTINRVRVVLGLPDLTTFEPSQWEAVCPVCKGRTRVKTGSLDPKYETKACDECEGRGYVSTRPRRQEEQPVPITDSNGTPPEGQWDDGVQRDMFGTPVTDEDYGKMPALRKRPIEYWQTHAN